MNKTIKPLIQKYNSIEEAQKAIKNCAIFCYIMACPAAWLGFHLGRYDLFMDTAILLIVGGALHKFRSGFAAYALFMYALLKGIHVFMGGAIAGAAGVVMYSLALAFLAYGIIAIRATSAYIKFCREENPTFRSGSQWTRILGILCGIIFFPIIVLTGASLVGLVPPTDVVSGDMLHKRIYNDIREAGLIESNEQIELFSPVSMFSVQGRGNILTDKRVIAYSKHEGELELQQAAFHEIIDVEELAKGNFSEDSIYMVYKNNGEGFVLQLIPTFDGDKKFIAALEKKISNNDRSLNKEDDKK